MIANPKSRQFKKCNTCYHKYYTTFCGYEARYCNIHKGIDCEPDNFIVQLEKEDKDCPDFCLTKEEWIERTKKENPLDKIDNINNLFYNKNKFKF